MPRLIAFLNLISELDNSFDFFNSNDFSENFIYSIIWFNSLGSSANEWSGPGKFLLNVKCFSIIFAPAATARAGVSGLSVWSDSPHLWRLS